MGRLILLILLVAVGVWVYFFLEAAGVFLNIEPKALACKPITGIVGVEDLTIDQEAKVAFLSGYDRRAAFKGENPAGAIWILDLNAPNALPIDVSAGLVATGFQPHGISLYRAADGKKTLFVINHANKRQTVEAFDVNGATLTHRGTVTGPELVSPNDIVGVGPDSFYVTNDHANAQGSWMRTAEDYLRLKMTTVQFYDGANFSPALSGIGGSNGINVSADGLSLYLSAASERTVHVYDRDPATNALTERAAVPVPGFADNIEVLADGNLLLGLHSKIFDLLGHVSDPTKLAPSHIMRLVASGKGFTPETIYYNLGDEISGASVGASIDGRLLIGAIFEPKILDCTLEHAP